jgi:predicted transcriptional regulator
MKVKSTPYLLFIFADFKNSSTILRDIPLQLSPISSSKYLKFNHDKSNLICNFESTLTFSDLRSFIDSTIGLIVDQWYLIEHSDNMAIHIEDSLKFNLLDLETENQIYPTNKGVVDKQDEEEMGKIMDYFLDRHMREMDNIDIESMLFNEDDEEDELITKLKRNKDNTLTKPTLDQLLEKVNEKGIKTLTKYEKQILDDYARN